MNPRGLRISRLSLVGSSTPPAIVEFAAGLNVVVGPSDTGKTFMTQCIDFALGGGNTPKAIPEAEGYASVILDVIATSDGSSYRLERGLRGGDIALTDSNGRVRKLSAKHAHGLTSNFSGFLLEVCGLLGRQVRTNKLGAKRSLSFRDLAKLVMVSEESVIASRSPIFSGNQPQRTSEQSVFRLLLTGVDDSAIITADSPASVVLRQEGRVQVLEELLSSAREELSVLGPLEDPLFAGLENEKLAAALLAARERLSIHRESAAGLELQRMQAWSDYQSVQTQLTNLLELRYRFSLLDQQYESDSQRLGAVAESAVLLDRLPVEKCPVCGSAPAHHDAEHAKRYSEPQLVLKASKTELMKLALLREDLTSTRLQNEQAISKLEESSKALKERFDATEASIKSEVAPLLGAALDEIRVLETSQRGVQRALDLHQRVAHLEVLVKESSVAPTRTKASSKQPIESAVLPATEEFCLAVEELLRSWRFPELTRVTFSDLTQDIVVSARPRGDRGKGVRALCRAAFNLGLMRYCLDGDKPHPGFVSIDSPLVVYREPDPDDSGFSPDVKDEFYRSLATAFLDSQVLVFENVEPPANIGASITHFSGSSTGRRGFIPSRSPFSESIGVP